MLENPGGGGHGPPLPTPIAPLPLEIFLPTPFDTVRLNNVYLLFNIYSQSDNCIVQAATGSAFNLRSRAGHRLHLPAIRAVRVVKMSARVIVSLSVSIASTSVCK